MMNSERKEYPLYAGGEFLSSSARLNVICPYDRRPVADTFLADEEILELSIRRALAAGQALAKMPAYARYEILMQIAGEMQARKAELARLLSLEAAKPLRYAASEIQRACATFIAAAEEAKRPAMECIRLDWEPSGKGKEGLVKHFPVGLVAGISPFNFPMNLAVHKIAPAIACGCPIILKPARSTPLSTLELARIIDGTALPRGALSVLPMDRETGNRLVTDERFRLLTFTGSPAVGWKMKAGAGKKKVVLELGGNAGVIVAASADREHALRRCVIGGFAYSGQVCIHTQRLFVARELFQEFAEDLVVRVKALKAGAPEDPETEVSSLINEENARRVEQWIEEAVLEGAELLCGGSRKDSFIEPTILTRTDNRMKVCCREVFGPVITIDPIDTFEEAVDKVNDSIYGLQAGVFTNRVDEMDYAFTHLQVGGVIHNDVSIFRVDHMPYGGIKDSGLGREGVKYAMLDMMEPRILVKSF